MIAAPAIAASPAVTVTASVAQPLPLVTATPKPARTATPRPTPSPRKTAAPVEAPEPAVQTPKEAIEALFRRGAAAKKKRPDREREIDEILADASIWLKSKDTGRALAAISELNKRLRALEK